MGEINDILELYIKDEGLFEERVKEIQLDMEEQTKLDLNESMNSASPAYLDLPRERQYQRTGHTEDSIFSEMRMEDDLTAIVRCYLNPGYPDYPVYVDENSIWGGYEFFKGGLERTMEMYG